ASETIMSDYTTTILARKRLRTLAAFMGAIALLLAGCQTDEVTSEPEPVAPEQEATEAAPPEPVTSSEAPRLDIEIYPGAQLVYEEMWPVAVEEFWSVDAPLEDVVTFYASMPGYEGLADSTTVQDDGGYLETELVRLVRSGETDPAVYEALVDEIGPLMILAVVSSESPALGSLLGRSGVEDAIPTGHTVIVFRVLTG
ncbi:MAG: hypothetical protein WD360_06550, partial [Nitriliruptoraceae bacterium]